MQHLLPGWVLYRVALHRFFYEVVYLAVLRTFYLSCLCVLMNRDKSQLPETPILSSMLQLARYHLGTVAKGSFIITLVEIPRLILTYIHNQLKGKVSKKINFKKAGTLEGPVEHAQQEHVNCILLCCCFSGECLCSLYS